MMRTSIRLNLTIQFATNLHIFASSSCLDCQTTHTVDLITRILKKTVEWWMALHPTTHSIMETFESVVCSKKGKEIGKKITIFL